MSAKLLAEAMKDNDGYLELKRIEAVRNIAEKISQSQNKVIVNTETLLFSTLQNDEKNHDKKNK
jgi:hypothetical protein